MSEAISEPFTIVRVSEDGHVSLEATCEGMPMRLAYEVSDALNRIAAEAFERGESSSIRFLFDGLGVGSLSELRGLVEKGRAADARAVPG